MKKENNRLTEIKNLIEKTGKKQKEVAELIGVNHIHLNGVLGERFPLTEDLYQRLKHHLTN